VANASTVLPTASHAGANNAVTELTAAKIASVPARMIVYMKFAPPNDSYDPMWVIDWVGWWS